MPNLRIGFRGLRKSQKHANRNLLVKTQVDFLLRQSRKLVSLKKLAEAKAQVAKTVKALDKAVSNKILKPNTASRLKSRLMKKLNAASAK